MAYPTGLEETRAGTLSAHPGYGCRWGENGRKRSNGKTMEMSEDQHSVVVVGGARQRASLPDFVVHLRVYHNAPHLLLSSGVSGAKSHQGGVNTNSGQTEHAN